MGYCSIPESIQVDRLAKAARDRANNDSIKVSPHLEALRQQILHASARLLMNISSLLFSSDGPSPDRLSFSAIANQASSEEDPEAHISLA